MLFCLAHVSHLPICCTFACVLFCVAQLIDNCEQWSYFCCVLCINGLTLWFIT